MTAMIRKLVVSFLLGVLSCSFTADMARAQARKIKKVEPKRKPTPWTKDKKTPISKSETKPGEKSTEDPHAGRKVIHIPQSDSNGKKSESHGDGSPPDPNSAQDSCKKSYKDDPSAQLKCEERKRKSVLKGKTTGPPA